jgi:hypothetical protein
MLLAAVVSWPGVEVVKASTWEQPFYKRISAARALELAVLKTTLLLQVRGSLGTAKAKRVAKNTSISEAPSVPACP